MTRSPSTRFYLVPPSRWVRRLAGWADRGRWVSVLVVGLLLATSPAHADSHPMPHPETGAPGQWLDEARAQQCVADAGDVVRLRGIEGDLRARLGNAWRVVERLDEDRRGLRLALDEAASVALQLREEVRRERARLPWWAHASIGAAGLLVVEAVVLVLVLAQ